MKPYSVSFFFDLAEIAFGPGDVQGVGDGFQMLDLGFRICQLFCKRLFCTLQFSVTVKIFFRVSEGVSVGSRGTVISSSV